MEFTLMHREIKVADVEMNSFYHIKSIKNIYAAAHMPVGTMQKTRRRSAGSGKVVEQTNHTKRSTKTAGGFGYKKYAYIKRTAQRQFRIKFIRSILAEAKRFLCVMGANPVF